MSEYPIRVLSLGAGVQSTTLLRMAIRSEVPPVSHAVFSDTGWEPRAVYEHLAVLQKECEEAGIKFTIVNRGNIRSDAYDLDKRWASVPVYIYSKQGKKAIMRRQCTYDYKIEPLLKEERAIAGLRKGQHCKEHRITTVIGISYDEAHRMKDPAFRWIQHDYPLVDMKITRQDCLDWNEENGFPLPPRSACIGCPYHNNEEWRRLKESPEDWADAVAFDNDLRSSDPLVQRLGGVQAFLHQSRVPLDQVDLRTTEEMGQGSLFGDECEGMCGI